MSKRATKRNRRKLQRRARELLVVARHQYPLYEVQLIEGSGANYESYDAYVRNVERAINGLLLREYDLEGVKWSVTRLREVLPTSDRPGRALDGVLLGRSSPDAPTE